MKKTLLFSFVVCLFSTLIVGCSDDSTPTDQYANWRNRNDAYLDSIVKVARKNTSGEWRIYKSFKKELEETGTVAQNLATLSKFDSVYVRVIEEGAAAVKPLFTDTIKVHYRGTLLNGNVFNQSYAGDLNPQVHTPSKFLLGGLVTGWVTAFLQMNVGTKAELYIPYHLGYGAVAKGTLPAYSVLKFNVYFSDIIHPKKP
ncbi:MAG: FKBP-type peptidyl-prolyl cis-trans isomerase [Phocaeicola sp.]|nr:FKBP-type peptidyl-prolyl cis-trans isomerase [Phocaeicola sp.]